MNISWSQLKPKEFEQLCCLILEANGFTDVRWFGESGNDKGRDILAKKLESPLPSIEKIANWVVQCKRYISKPPNKDDIASFLTATREHKPDNVLIAVTNTLSSNTKDWLESIRSDYPFQIYLWEERDLLREVYKHKRHISERLPKIYSQSDSVYFYHLRGNEIHFACNEFEEISIVVMNHGETGEGDIDRAREHVAEFIQFLKHNDVEFDWPEKRRRRT
jgi:hypothetical protein